MSRPDLLERGVDTDTLAGTAYLQHECGCEYAYHTPCCMTVAWEDRAVLLTHRKCPDCAAKWHSDEANGISAIYQRFMDYGVPIIIDMD